MTYAGETAEFTYPDTRVGEIARAWIDQFNSGDDEQTRRFEETYRAESALKKRSVEDRIARYPQLRGMLGTLSPHTVLDQTPSGLKLLARSESIPPIAIIFPGKLALIGSRPIPALSGCD